MFLLLWTIRPEADCTAFTHVAACLLAEPPEAARGLEGFGGFVTPTTAPRATGWSDQLPGGNRTR